MRAIVRTASSGSCPIAVSPESITASVPSNTELATSLASARVGRELCTIDSSICVAVMTGRPHATQVRMIRFWRCGTSSVGHSMPRSPRATITASAASRMAGRFSQAARVSIFASSIGPSSPTAARTSRTSSAVRTKDTATISGATGARISRSSRSSGGGRRQAQLLRRQVHAGPALHATAGHDDRLQDPARLALDLEEDEAVAEGHAVARRQVLEQSAVLHFDAVRRRRVVARHELDDVGLAQEHAPVGERRGAHLRAREVGEHRRRACPPARRPRRMRAMRSRCSSGSPWARPMRQTSTPARNSATRSSAPSQAGPIVATIFVRRPTAQRYDDRR